jgi:hypothetical protein
MLQIIRHLLQLLHLGLDLLGIGLCLDLVDDFGLGLMQVGLHLVVDLPDLGINELHINRLHFSALLYDSGLSSIVVGRLLLRFYTVLAIRPG